VLLLVGTMGLGSLYAADFGAAQWGMSLAEVKTLESRTNLTPFGQQDYLIYKVVLSGIEQARIVYQFSNRTLVSGRFTFSTNDPLNIEQALAQYQQITSRMSSQYGPPDQDQVLTNKNTGEAPAAADYARELAADRLILKSSWQSASATIRQQLAWQLTQPNHQLVYLPIEPIALPEIKTIPLPEIKNAF
jgi:hypothetical protein